MIDGELVGVGILTCNRAQQFKNLYAQVLQCKDVDKIVVVKNKDYDYDDLEFTEQHVHYIHEPQDLGIGHCKNLALLELLKSECQHIFLIEDDVIIKSKDVFQVYIETAKSFGLGHLNFSRAWNSQENKFLIPYTSIVKSETMQLDIFFRLCGDFQYFQRDALLRVGLIDSENFVNALEHAEHTYRFCINNLYTPFYAFADVHNSHQYLEDGGVQSSINHEDAIYKKRIQHAAKTFKQRYGLAISQIQIPSRDSLIQVVSRFVSMQSRKVI